MNLEGSMRILGLAVILLVPVGCDDSPPLNRDGYAASIVPDNMTVLEKKKRFVSLVAPSVIEIHADLNKDYSEIARLVTTGTGDPVLERLKREYRAENNQALLNALKPHPPSIALAQAAMESGWGTSRFFVEANNIFGVWSFDENEPRIAAGKKRGNKTIWLKKYASLDDSVRDYYRVLSRGTAFKEFRELKMNTDDPHVLVKKLDHYSEKGDEYSEELSSVIRANRFDSYDK